ncbi:MAG: oligopeptide ABC transporter permease [Deinococcota bacterium]
MTSISLSSTPLKQPIKRRVWRNFMSHKLAVISGGVLILLMLTAIFAPVLAPYDPYDLAMTEDGLLEFEAPPSPVFLLGTDAIGRDVLSRLIFGGRISLTIGLVSASIAIVLGSLLGVLAGYFGGLADALLSRFADAVSTFPALFLILTVSSFVRPSIFNVMAVIGLLSWMPTFRLMRAEVLRLSHVDFIEGAHALGAGNIRIMLQHLMPNAIAPIIVQATLGVAEAILTESALSFLGLGVQQPIASWGNMLADARNFTVLQSQPWLWVPPGAAIFITVLAINFMGDGLRDALNPRQGS